MMTTQRREGPPDKMGHMAQHCFDQYIHVVTIAAELKRVFLLLHNCLILQLVGEVKSFQKLAKKGQYNYEKSINVIRNGIKSQETREWDS